MSKIRRPKPSLPKADKQEKTAVVKYFNLEKASVKGFCGFCQNNIPLVVAVTLTLFFTYGIRLFWYTIGIDSELFWADKATFMRWEIETGRFGLYLLSKLWHIREFNPFTAFFVTLCLVWFFTLSWCYIIAIFSKNTGRNNALIPFALVFMTVPVWAEQFSYVFQAAEIALMIGICPYAVYLLYKGILDSEKGKIIGGVLLVFVMPSIYQAMIPLFCCGVFACFLLFQENSDYEPKVYRLLCLKLFLALLAALGAYFLVERIIVPFVFHIQRNQVMEGMVAWKTRPLTENLFIILLFCYALTFGSIPAVQAVMRPVFERNGPAGIAALEYVSGLSRLGNAVLVPVVILFLFTVFKTKRNLIPPGRKLLYCLAGIGVPLSILFLIRKATGDREAPYEPDVSAEADDSYFGWPKRAGKTGICEDGSRGRYNRKHAGGVCGTAPGGGSGDRRRRIWFIYQSIFKRNTRTPSEAIWDERDGRAFAPPHTTIVSNAKRYIPGMYHRPNGKHFQAYPDGFCYRMNRRFFAPRLFDRPLCACAAASAITYQTLVSESS